MGNSREGTPGVANGCEGRSPARVTAIPAPSASVLGPAAPALLSTRKRCTDELRVIFIIGELGGLVLYAI